MQTPPYVRIFMLACALFLQNEVWAGPNLIYVYDPEGCVQQYDKGSHAADLDVTRKLYRAVVRYSIAPLPPTPTIKNKANYVATVLRRMGVEVKVEAAGDVFACKTENYELGYYKRMNELLEKRFGKGFRQRIEADADRIFGPDYQ